MENTPLPALCFEDTIIFETESHPVYTAVLLIPAQWAERFLELGIKRVIIHFNGIRKRSAILKNKHGEYFVMVNKKEQKEANLVLGKPLHLKIETDLQPDDLDYPEEFVEVLAQDTQVEAMWYKISVGKQRGLLYYINSGKTVETRVKRAIEIGRRVVSGEFLPKLKKAKD